MVATEEKQLNGIFKTYIQTSTSQIQCLFDLFLLIAIFILGIYLLTTEGFFMGIIAVLIGLLWGNFSLCAFLKKRGMTMQGFLFFEGGVETGMLSVELADIKTKVNLAEFYEGTIDKSKWTSELVTNDTDLNLVVVVKKKLNSNKLYYFDSFSIYNKNGSLINKINTPDNILEGFHFVALMNQNFKEIGDINKFIKYYELLPSLEMIQRVISNYNNINCTLNISLQKSNIEGLLIFGLVGVSILAIDESLHRKSLKKLEKKFDSNTLFDNKFTEQLLNFVKKYKWKIQILDFVQN